MNFAREAATVHLSVEGFAATLACLGDPLYHEGRGAKWPGTGEVRFLIPIGFLKKTERNQNPDLTYFH